MTYLDRVAGGVESRLWQEPEPGGFIVEEVEALPEPVRRHLRMAISPGAPLDQTARLRMRGRIKVGRWLPFRATQVLSPHRGFVWTARVGGVITGSDSYLDGAGEMRWKLASLVTVAHGAGPDVSRSAAGRVAAEAIWLPTSLLPRCGVRWTDDGCDRASLDYQLGSHPVTVTYQLDPAGRITSLVFDRWGDPDNVGLWGWHPFGGEVTSYARFGGLTVPSEGLMGWHFGTNRWPDGAFFQFRITNLQPATDSRVASHRSRRRTR
jgi:hypothetical protein